MLGVEGRHCSADGQDAILEVEPGLSVQRADQISPGSGEA